MMQGSVGFAEAALPAGVDVVFIAPDDPSGSRSAGTQRTIAFSPGQPIPRVGECVILAFDGTPKRWTVQDVAHIFEADGHGIAIKLALPVE